MENELTLEIAFDLLHIDGDTRKASTDIVCPECGASHGKKLNVNFAKQVFRCNRCGVGGGVLQFWALFRGLRSDDLKEISLDYFSFIGASSEREALVKMDRPKTECCDLVLAPLRTRDNTYRNLLSLLSLREEHKEDLLRRGFTEEEIEKSDYKSYPNFGRKDISRKLLEKGCILKGVPGFYVDEDGDWTLKKVGDGYLIPQKTSKGMIQGFQIRRSSGNIRYITLSTTGMKDGTQGKANVHFARGWNENGKVVITEGPLKADLICKFTGFSVLAVQGVNATASLPVAIDSLKKQGFNEALIAFDMDLVENDQVCAALGRMKDLLAEHDVSYKTIFWDEKYKGLDDWLLSRIESSTCYQQWGN